MRALICEKLTLLSEYIKILLTKLGVSTGLKLLRQDEEMTRIRFLKIMLHPSMLTNPSHSSTSFQL